MRLDYVTYNRTQLQLIIIRSMEDKVKQYDTPPPNYSLLQHATHGFSHRPSLAQIASYITIAASIAIYFSSTVPIKHNSVLLGLYIVFGVVMVVTAALATLADPTDRMVYYYKWSRHDKKVIFSPEYDKILFCQYCDSYCLANSKHCRTCNRCVNKFDHHCMWFNNCVGETNYNYFLVCIICTFSYATVIIVHVALTSFSVDFGDRAQLMKIVFSWIIALVMAVFGFLIINLIILHLYLIATGQTTYQFLQRKKSEDEHEQEELKKKEKGNEERQKGKNNQESLNQIFSSKGETKPIELSSEESIVNTKMVLVQNQRDTEPENVRTGRRKKKRKVQNEYFEEQVDKHSKKSDEQNSTHSKPNENDVTFHQESLQQPQQLSGSSSKKKLPNFLTKNKSIKLFLSQSHAQSPTKRLQPLNV